MGAETIAIIRKGTTLEQIAEALEGKYGNTVNIHGHSEQFADIKLESGTDTRYIFVSFSNACERDYGIEGVQLNLGLWGDSVEILRCLCETFGGYLDENNCDTEGFYPINYHLYQLGVDFTPMDKLRHKLISFIGVSKMQVVINCLEQYLEEIQSKSTS